MLKNILLAFVPIFVAVDMIGVVPIFVSLTQNLEQERKKEIIFQSLWTALSLAIGFIFLGKIIFKLLGITIGDFMIAGGSILFCIAIIDLIEPGKERRAIADDFGVVPLGTPLIVGPAVLTTSLIIIDQYGLLPTIIAVILNIILVGIMFTFSDFIITKVGKSGAVALSKIMALLLAAIAVMMIRKGIFQTIGVFK